MPLKNLKDFHTENIPPFSSNHRIVQRCFSCRQSELTPVVRIIANVSGDDRIKRRSYTHLRHVLPLCTPAPSGAKPFAVLSERGARASR